MAVRVYGELEYGLSLLKVITIIVRRSQQSWLTLGLYCHEHCSQLWWKQGPPLHRWHQLAHRRRTFRRWFRRFRFRIRYCVFCM